MKLNLLRLSIFLIITKFLTGCVHTTYKNYNELKKSEFSDSNRKIILRHADHYHAELLENNQILHYPKYSSYLNRLVTRLKGKSKGDFTNFRVFILKDPTVNASALPNGHIYLNIALLTAMSSEAELAFVLSHEMEHVYAGHSIIDYHQSIQLRKQANMDSAITGAIGLWALFYSKSANEEANQRNARMFSREQESEADVGGLKRYLHSGYSLDTALASLTRVDVRKERLADAKPSPWATHPSIDFRIKALKEEGRQIDSTIANRNLISDKIFQEFRRKLVQESITLKINSYLVELALDEIEKEADTQLPALIYLKALAYQKMAENPVAAARENMALYDRKPEEFPAVKKKFIESSLQHLEKAVSIYQSISKGHRFYALSRRNMGLIYIGMEKPKQAIAQLNQYLNSGSKIPDKRFIKSKLQELEMKGI